VTCHVFAETTHVVASTLGFACAATPATLLFILGFIQIRSGFSEPRRGRNLPFPVTFAIGFYCRTSRDKSLILCEPVVSRVTHAINLSPTGKIYVNADCCFSVGEKLASPNQVHGKWQCIKPRKTAVDSRFRCMSLTTTV